MTDEAVVQILKAINDFREEFRDEKIKNEKRWEENDRRWKENEKCWEENEKRWEENEKRWEENNRRWEENEKCWEENNRRWEENRKLWIQNERNRQRDRDEIKDIIWSFQTSVEQNEKRIDNIEKLCPKCKVKVV